MDPLRLLAALGVPEREIPRKLKKLALLYQVSRKYQETKTDGE